MVAPDRALDQLEHRKAVVGKDLGHVVEEIVIILAKRESLERDLGEQRLEVRRELALDGPILCDGVSAHLASTSSTRTLRNGLLQFVEGVFQLRRECAL